MATLLLKYFSFKWLVSGFAPSTAIYRGMKTSTFDSEVPHKALGANKMYHSLRGFLESIQTPHLLLKFPVQSNSTLADENNGIWIVSIFTGIDVTSPSIKDEII